MVDEKYMEGPSAGTDEAKKVPWVHPELRDGYDKEGLDTPIPEPVEADPEKKENPQKSNEEKASAEGQRGMTYLA